MSEAATAHVTLHEVTPSIFDHLLDWMYTGTTDIAESALPDLLAASCRLQVDGVPAAIEECLIARLDASSALSSWKMGEELELPDLRDAAKEVALTCLPDLVASADFASISAACLEELLSSEQLRVADESVVYGALKTWHSQQMTSWDRRQQMTDEDLGKLLRCVRWTLLTAATMQEVNEDPMVTGHPEGFRIVALAFQAPFFKLPTPQVRSASPLRFADLRQGMSVRLLDDLAYIEAQCNSIVEGASKKAGWSLTKERATPSLAGKTVTIEAVNVESQGAKASFGGGVFVYPHTVLHRP